MERVHRSSQLSEKCELSECLDEEIVGFEPEEEEEEEEPVASGA